MTYTSCAADEELAATLRIIESIILGRPNFNYVTAQALAAISLIIHHSYYSSFIIPSLFMNHTHHHYL